MDGFPLFQVSACYRRMLYCIRVSILLYCYGRQNEGGRRRDDFRHSVGNYYCRLGPRWWSSPGLFHREKIYDELFKEEPAN